MASLAFWIFPPQGPANNEGSCGVASDIGPVHLDDVIVLQWIADGDPYDVKLACCGNEGTVETNATSSPWPVKFTADLVPGLNSSDEIWGCHFWNGRKMGSADNTVVFPYVNLPGEEIITWKATASSTAAHSMTSATSSSLSSSGTPTSSSTASSTPPQAAGQGLSPTAEGGIGAATGVVGLALVLIGYLAFQHRRNARARVTQSPRSVTPPDTKPEESEMRPLAQNPLAGTLYSHPSAEDSARQLNGGVTGSAYFYRDHIVINSHDRLPIPARETES